MSADQQAAGYTPREGDRVRVRRWVQTTAGACSDERVYTGRITEVDGPEADGWFICLDTHPDRIYTGYQFLGAGGKLGTGPASLMTEVTLLDDADGQDAYRVQVSPDLAVALDGSQCVVLDVIHPGTGIRLHQVTVTDVSALQAALAGALAARPVVEAAGDARRALGVEEARRARGVLTRIEAVEWLIARLMSHGRAVDMTRQLRNEPGTSADGMTYLDGYWRVPAEPAPRVLGIVVPAQPEAPFDDPFSPMKPHPVLGLPVPEESP